VYCLTLCDECVTVALEGIPSLSGSEAAGRAGEHCEHLGIDLERMAKALQAEQG